MSNVHLTKTHLNTPHVEDTYNNALQILISMFFTKHNTKKQQIFEKYDHFKNGQNGPLCNGNSI